MEAWREELYHYAKGSTAKDHKYIRKEGKRYIYAEPSGANKSKSAIGDWLNNAANSVGNWVSGAANSVSSFVQNATDPKVIAAQKDLRNAELGLAKTKTNYKDIISNYETAKKNAQNGLEAGFREYNRIHSDNKTVDFDSLFEKMYDKYWREKEPVGAALSTMIKHLLWDEYKYVADNIDDDTVAYLGLVLQYRDKYSEYQQEARKWEALIQERKAKLDSLKHSEPESPDLYHTAIGGTLIITRR